MPRSAAVRVYPIVMAWLCAVAAWSQDGRTIRVLPERPEAGTGFTIEIGLTGERASDVEALEPAVIGPARYLGVDIAPAASRAGPPGTLLVFRFQALAPGRVDIMGLSARSGTRLLSFGSWSVEVQAAASAPIERRGSWRAPSSAYERTAFSIAALDPSGNDYPSPGLAVAGALLEPEPDGRSYRLTALGPGRLLLPRLELQAEDGGFVVQEREITILPAGDVAAVGGPWLLALALQGGYEARVGELVAWDLRAIGPERSSLASPPRIIIVSPSGKHVETTSQAYSGVEEASSRAYVGLRGAFVVAEPGDYALRPEPYAWFDLGSKAARKAVASSATLRVSPAALAPWAPPARLREAAAAAELRLEGSTDTLAKDAASARAARDRALVLLADAEAEPARRAEAYAVLLRAERAAFAGPGASALARAADEAFGNQARPKRVIPPYGWLAALAAPCLIGAFLFGLQRGRRLARGLARGLAVASLALALAAAASLVEASVSRFVALGGSRWAAPSELARVSGRAEPGLTGRVLRLAGSWAWVEFDEGGTAWLAVDDIATY